MKTKKRIISKKSINIILLVITILSLSIGLLELLVIPTNQSPTKSNRELVEPSRTTTLLGVSIINKENKIINEVQKNNKLPKTQNTFFYLKKQSSFVSSKLINFLNNKNKNFIQAANISENISNNKEKKGEKDNKNSEQNKKEIKEINEEIQTISLSEFRPNKDINNKEVLNKNENTNDGELLFNKSEVNKLQDEYLRKYSEKVIMPNILIYKPITRKYEELVCDQIWNDSLLFVYKDDKTVDYITQTCLKDFGATSKEIEQYLKKIILIDMTSGRPLRDIKKQFKERYNIRVKWQYDDYDIMSKTKHLLNTFDLYAGDISSKNQHMHILTVDQYRNFLKYKKIVLYINYLFVQEMNEYLKEKNIKQDYLDWWANGQVVDVLGDWLNCTVYTLTQALELSSTYSNVFWNRNHKESLDFKDMKYKFKKYFEERTSENNIEKRFNYFENQRIKINKEHNIYGLTSTFIKKILLDSFSYSSINETTKSGINNGLFVFYSLSSGWKYWHSAFGINTIKGWYIYLPEKGKYQSLEKLKKDGTLKTVFPNAININNSDNFKENFSVFYE